MQKILPQYLATEREVLLERLPHQQDILTPSTELIYNRHVNEPAVSIQ